MNKAALYDVIKSPVITEKATMSSEQDKVMFNVAKTATKPQIKQAVDTLFEVKVKVTLEAGQAIDGATGL